MSTIYSRARRVIVWLGNSESGYTILAMNFIRRAVEEEFDNPRSDSPFRLDLAPNIVLDRYESNLPILNELFRNPWFSRAWPVQEVAFAQECKIVFGKHSISADQLMHFLTVVKDHTIVNHDIHRAHIHRQMWR